MTKEELIAELRAAAEDDYPKSSHIRADGALLDFINDPDVTAAWRAVHKWFA